jgi:hypothetical protein
MFLHGSWTHVIATCGFYALWRQSEDAWTGKFLLFYLTAVIMPPSRITSSTRFARAGVGASGAVAGIMELIFTVPQAKVLTFVPPFFLLNLPAWIYLGFWALSQLWCGAAQVFASMPADRSHFGLISEASWPYVSYRYFCKNNLNITIKPCNLNFNQDRFPFPQIVDKIFICSSADEYRIVVLQEVDGISILPGWPLFPSKAALLQNIHTFLDSVCPSGIQIVFEQLQVFTS